MIRGACHCGAIGFELDAAPDWLTACNCSMCRRIGGLWAHAERSKITASYAPADAARYVHGDRTLALIFCKRCGCVTHWESLDPDPNARMAVNCACAEPADIAGLRVRRFDGADSWEFLD